LIGYLNVDIIELGHTG